VTAIAVLSHYNHILKSFLRKSRQSGEKTGDLYELVKGWVY